MKGTAARVVPTEPHRPCKDGAKGDLCGRPCSARQVHFFSLPLRRQWLTCLCLLFVAVSSLLAKKRFEWTPTLRSAYEKTNSLRFAEAEAELATVRSKDPNNLMVLHVENYLDFFRVYINEEEKEFRKLEKKGEERIERIEEEGDPESPYYLFLQADIRLQWAAGRLKFEEYSTAFFETNKAFKLLKRNEEKFPNFMPNKKDLAILYAITGTIPDNYKWAVDWLTSLEGTMEDGKHELKLVIEHARTHDFIYETEIYVYYAYLLLHLGNDGDEAWRIINTTKLEPAKNPIACFLKANVAMRTNRGDEAIALLENRPKGSEFHPFHYLDYMLGLVKLQRLDKDADLPLKRFLDNFKGRNFIKDACQKLAWHSLLQSDHAAYLRYVERCKSSGYTIVGNDRNAHEEAQKGEMPHLDLLKARLLFDGGRFQKAYDLLSKKSAGDFLATKNQLEFGYRMGRICQKLNKASQALDFYEKTIERGRGEPWYFACRAALEKGLILESQQKKKEAKAAFELCLSLSPSDHKTGLHQQAKAGLKRLK